MWQHPAMHPDKASGAKISCFARLVLIDVLLVLLVILCFVSAASFLRVTIALSGLLPTHLLTGYLH